MIAINGLFATEVQQSVFIDKKITFDSICLTFNFVALNKSNILLLDRVLLLGN